MTPEQEARIRTLAEAHASAAMALEWKNMMNMQSDPTKRIQQMADYAVAVVVERETHAALNAAMAAVAT